LPWVTPSAATTPDMCLNQTSAPSYTNRRAGGRCRPLSGPTVRNWRRPAHLTSNVPAVYAQLVPALEADPVSAERSSAACADVTRGGAPAARANTTGWASCPSGPPVSRCRSPGRVCDRTRPCRDLHRALRFTDALPAASRAAAGRPGPSCFLPRRRTRSGSGPYGNPSTRAAGSDRVLLFENAEVLTGPWSSALADPTTRTLRGLFRVFPASFPITSS